MTNKEAIDSLIGIHEGLFSYEPEVYPNFSKAIRLAISALEKQIPKKPNFTDDYYDVAVCPTCNTFEFEYGTSTWKMRFCPECGQAIDWSDTDD